MCEVNENDCKLLELGLDLLTHPIHIPSHLYLPWYLPLTSYRIYRLEYILMTVCKKAAITM